MREESTCHGASGAIRIISASQPGAMRPASTPRMREGLPLSSSNSRPMLTCPSRTSPSAIASSVSAPAIPGAASAKGRRLSSGPRGSWPEEMTSTVPSATAAMQASRSSSARSGGDSRAKVRKPVTAMSDRNRCAGVMPQLMRSPRALASRIRSNPRAVVTWRKWTCAPLSSASIRSRAIDSASAIAGACGKPSLVAVSPPVATAWPVSPPSSLCTNSGRSSAAA